MKRILLLSFVASVAVQSVNAQNAQSNIAVLMTAPGPLPANVAASIAILSPFGTQTTPVNTILIDTTGTNALRFSGSATSTGYLSNSYDRTLLSFAGANTTSATTTNTNSILTRGVGTVNASGTYTLATTFTESTSGNQPRSATSLNNTNWYIADQSGLFTNLATAPSPAGNFRAAKAYGGAVYIASASTTTSVIQVNTVSAITGGTLTGLPGLTNNGNLQDFCMIRSGNNGIIYDILYVISATSNTAGTITKFSLVNSSWTANGSYTTTFGGFGINAVDTGNGAFIYVTTGQGALAANNVTRLYDAAGYTTALNITTANNTVLYTAPAGYIIKGIAFAPTLLPLAISLADITAKNNGNTNTINWSTAHEDAGDNMELARSTDGRNFTTIAKINGKGSNSKYSFSDDAPVTGANYYRLQMNEANGAATYSSVVAATVKQVTFSNVVILPNPVLYQNFQVSFNSTATGNCQIVVNNELGQIVYSAIQNISKANTVTINLPSSLRKGIYYLSLSAGNDQFTKRVIVE